MYKSFLLFFVLLASKNASALTIDYRHDYFDDQKENKDRVLISHLFNNNIGGSFEQRFKSTKPSSAPIHRLFYNGNELSAYYNIRYDNLTLQPGFAYDRTVTNYTFKPSITLKYKPINELTINFSSRYESSNSRNDKVSDSHVKRVDLWGNYKISNYNIGLNYMYKEGNVILYNNKKSDYLYNASLSYSINKNLSPYMEIGNVSVKRTSADRQTRYRIGLKYNF